MACSQSWVRTHPTCHVKKLQRMSSKGIFTVPPVTNEPVLSYAPGSPERKALQEAYDALFANPIDAPMVIGGKEVRTGKTKPLVCPHDHKHNIGVYHVGGAEHVTQAIDAGLAAKKNWEALSWENRAAIFLKAADLLAGPYRAKINAATMIGQSKNAYQAEIDSSCELIDFLRFNVQFAQDIYRQQPGSSKQIWNRVEYNPLEGFVLAITPFNFTAIAGNLPTSAALMGNVVVWKPSKTQIYSAVVIMEVLQAAGLPAGVINLIYSGGPDTSKVCFEHPAFAGVHFTGSTGVFQDMWKTIGQNIHKYATYPRIVGETGGKDFILAHPSADVKAVITSITRGAFEYQGQKCSAASRGYIPANMWEEVKAGVLADLASVKMGTPRDFTNFVNAVIDEAAFDSITGYIEKARSTPDATIIAGGTYDKAAGYFIAPTVIQAHDPKFITMVDEIFGPVFTLYVYQPEDWEATLALVDSTSPYALTGAIFSQDRYAIEQATRALAHAAGNFYINDKPTGAVVNQQPFGGGRASGTNDKAGSMQNLLRWVSVRSIKENFVPPVDYRYPFLAADA
eukprot:m.222271 g.222271  ORF g.222271 m.222271 type:complete len:567 (+) comp10733_c0_seq1:1218-2918(+)